MNSVQLMNLSTFDYIEISRNDFNYEIDENFDLFGFYWNDNLFMDQIAPFSKKRNQTMLEDDDKAFV